MSEKEILLVLGNFNNILVRVITTSANANLTELEKFAKDKEWIEFFVDTNKMAKILNSCDFAIVTSGVILHEVIFLEKPFLEIKTAENQECFYSYLIKNHYDVFAEFDANDLKIPLRKFIKL